MRKAIEALLSALSVKNRDSKIIVVSKLEPEQPKTKIMVKALADLKVGTTSVAPTFRWTRVLLDAEQLDVEHEKGDGDEIEADVAAFHGDL